jgi:hypothetical protein
LFQTFLSAASKFWRDHVDAKVPPTAGLADFGALKKLYPESRVSDYLEANDELTAEITHYQELKASEKKLENEIDRVKVFLAQAIGDRSGIIGAFGRIDYKSNKSMLNINWKEIALELGAGIDIINRHTTTKPGARPFVLRTAKENK